MKLKEKINNDLDDIKNCEYACVFIITVLLSSLFVNIMQSLKNQISGRCLSKKMYTNASMQKYLEDIVRSREETADILMNPSRYFA